MKLNTKKELDEAIIELEKKKAIQYNLLIEQYHQTAEGLRPGNLIRGAFSSIVHSPGAKSGILKTVSGIAFGLLTKKLFMGKSNGLFQKLVGNALKIGVAKTAISNTDKIRAYGSAIYNNLFKKKPSI